MFHVIVANLRLKMYLNKGNYLQFISGLENQIENKRRAAKGTDRSLNFFDKINSESECV